MKTHEFTLIISAEDTLEAADKLFEAGCDDATVSRSGGVTRMGFDREAETLEEAIASAIANVTSAGYEVVRVEPDDLVTAAEVGEKLGQSRQSIWLYSTGARGPGGFPAPASGAGRRSALYRWSEVAAWANEHLAIEIETPDARTIPAFNAALELKRYGAEDASRFLQLVGGR